MVTLTLLSNRKQMGYDVCFTLYIKCLNSSLYIEKLKINVKSINIPTVNMKYAIFQFSLGEILSSLCKIFKSRFHGNHCQKREMLCAVKVFHEG